MNFEFKSKEELFLKVRPALYVKESELHKLGYTFVTDIDVWNYLIQIKWTNASNLKLCDVVNDIINADNTGVVEYAKDRIEIIKSEDSSSRNDEIF